MDPYLEDPGGWAGVHDAFIAILRELLRREVGPRFFVDGGVSVYILSPDDRRWVYPDVFLVETPAPATLQLGRGMIATPVRITPAQPMEVRQPYLLVRDRATRRVVTVIEVLSPVNKAEGTSGREEFLRKRREVMQSETHWLEIDLLRAGDRPPELRGASDYYALLKRGDASDDAVEAWPFSLRDTMPTIAVPLVRPLDDAPLALQQAIDLLFQRYGYAEWLAYESPPPPPLDAADAIWVAERVRQWRVAQAG
jgi:hypothetical protein